MILRSRIAIFALFLFLILLLCLAPFQLKDRFGNVVPPPETPIGTPDNGMYAEKTDYTSSAASPGDGCVEKADWLSELANSPDIKFPLRYARRDIIVRERPNVERASVVQHDAALLPEFRKVVSPDKTELDAKSCLPPLHLEVPPFPKTLDASHVLLGVATTLQRLEASIQYFQRWLPKTGTRLIVDVKGNDDRWPDSKDMANLQRRMRELGMAVTLVPPMEKKGNNVQRYFSLIKTLYKYHDENTRWFGFIDDDTFFTSMSGLLSRLNDFDPQKRWYLGAVSEEWWTVCQYGWIGMGGGGIFLSLPLLEVLEKNYADCKKKATRIFGDHRIAECIERHTDTRLTHIDGLHQTDLHGDRSGVFESGRQIFSQHHWKEGYWSEDGSGPDNIRHPRWFPLDTMSLVSDVCGDTCFLQRWQFGKDTLLTNGYSVAVYPKGRLKNLELYKMEKTWVTPINVEHSLNSGYDHYLGPLRPALELDKEKVHYRFMDAKLTKEGGVRQYFRHLGLGMESDMAPGLVPLPCDRGEPTIIQCSRSFFEDTEGSLHAFAEAFCIHNRPHPAVCNKTFIQMMYQTQLNHVFGSDRDSIKLFSQESLSDDQVRNLYQTTLKESMSIQGDHPANGTFNIVKTPTPEPLSPIFGSEKVLEHGNKGPNNHVACMSDVYRTTNDSVRDDTNSANANANLMPTKKLSPAQCDSLLGRENRAIKPSNLASGPGMVEGPVPEGLMEFFVPQSTAKDTFKVKMEAESETPIKMEDDGAQQPITTIDPAIDTFSESVQRTPAENMSGQGDGTPPSPSGQFDGYLDQQHDHSPSFGLASSGQGMLMNSNGLRTRGNRKSYVEQGSSGSPSTDDDSEDDYKPLAEVSSSEEELDESDNLSILCGADSVVDERTRPQRRARRAKRTERGSLQAVSTEKVGRLPSTARILPPNIQQRYGYSAIHKHHAERRYLRELGHHGSVNDPTTSQLGTSWRTGMSHTIVPLDDVLGKSSRVLDVWDFDEQYGVEIRVLPEERESVHQHRDYQYLVDDDSEMDFDTDMESDAFTLAWFERSVARGEFASKFKPLVPKSRLARQPRKINFIDLTEDN